MNERVPVLVILVGTSESFIFKADGNPHGNHRATRISKIRLTKPERRKVTSIGSIESEERDEENGRNFFRGEHDDPA